MERWGWTGIIMVCLFFFVTLFLVLKMAQRMEKHADHTAHAEEDEPGFYAKTLEKVYRLNFIPPVSPFKTRLFVNLCG
jgi:hypothetical protein